MSGTVETCELGVVIGADAALHHHVADLEEGDATPNITVQITTAPMICARS